MKIIISNDDSIHSQGIKSIQNVLQKDLITDIITKFDISKAIREKSLEYTCDVWLVAPEEEQSAKSHSFTMRHPLFIKKYTDREITLRGTPADCVYFALTHFITTLGDGFNLDWVVSGINHGSNLGTDIYYSGTVGAAREGCLRGYPAIAVSLHKNTQRAFDKEDFYLAALVLKILLYYLPKPPSGIFFNLNVPQDIAQPLSIQVAPVGVRLYESTVQIQKSPTGQEFCWLGGPAIGYDGGIHGDNCDIAICEQGHITLSILNLFGKEVKEELHLKVQEACQKAQSILSTYIASSTRE